MSMNKQTAVEWLVEEINNQKCWADPTRLEIIIQQAKEMEKEQMKQCADVFELDGFQRCFLNSNPYEHNKHISIDFEQYYNETYGS